VLTPRPLSGGEQRPFYLCGKPQAGHAAVLGELATDSASVVCGVGQNWNAPEHGDAELVPRLARESGNSVLGGMGSCHRDHVAGSRASDSCAAGLLSKCRRLFRPAARLAFQELSKTLPVLPNFRSPRTEGAAYVSRFGDDAAMPDVLAELARCDRRGSFSTPCGARFSDLTPWRSDDPETPGS